MTRTPFSHQFGPQLRQLSCQSSLQLLLCRIVLSAIFTIATKVAPFARLPCKILDGDPVCTHLLQKPLPEATPPQRSCNVRSYKKSQRDAVQARLRPGSNGTNSSIDFPSSRCESNSTGFASAIQGEHAAQDSYRGRWSRCSPLGLGSRLQLCPVPQTHGRWS